MRSLRRFLTRLANFAIRRRDDERLKEEIEEHVALQTAENLRAGLSPAEARRQALLKFGGAEAIKEDYRAERGMLFIETLVQDLHYALRMLRKSPGFTAVAVLTLALGIGANTAIFSLIDAVMLRSLPVKNPSQLVLLRWSVRHFPRIHSYKFSGDCLETDLDPESGGANPSGCSFSEPMFQEIRRTNVFSAVGAFASLGPDSLDLSGNGAATGIKGELVSGDFFHTMGVKAALGRLLEPADNAPSAPAVAVLSYSYWQSAFGGSHEVLGRMIELNKILVTIIGVAESRFTGMTPGTDYDLWLPLSDMQRINGWQKPQSDERSWWLTIIGRLKPGAQREQAQAAVSGLFRNEMLHGPQTLSTAADDPEIALVPAQTGLTGDRSLYANPLYVLMLGVGIILLITCANVAGLMLARSAARKKEMAVRLALGAGRGRIVRQLLTGSVMLSVLGGAMGILLANWGAHAVISFVSRNQPQPVAFVTGIDTRVLGFAIAVSLLSGVLFGIAPAFRSIRVDLTPTLKEGEGSSGFADRKWFSIGNGLVIAQVALTIVVLAGAGLLVRTLANLRSVNVGFDTHNVLSFAVNLRRLGYKGPQLDGLYRHLQNRLAETPGVQGASYSNDPLLGDYLDNASFHWPGSPQDEESEADDLLVGPNFFSTMRVPSLSGRDFNSSDFELAAVNASAKPSNAPTPVIVNQEFVERFVGKANPIGKRFGETAGDTERPGNPGFEIIGVVRDTRFYNLRREIRPIMYEPRSAGWAWFELRTTVDSQAILPAVRKVVAQVDANLPLFDVRTESEQINRLLFREQLVAWLSGFFGLLALVLACIGLFGLLSYEVSRRTREIGIRMALGAQPRDVLKLVVGEGIGLAIAGATVGIGVALTVTRYLNSMLYDLRANDPLTFAGVAILLMVVVLAACYIPARRAMRVDPMVALRHE